MDFYSSGEWSSSSAEDADSWLEAAVGAAAAALSVTPPGSEGLPGQPRRGPSRRRLRQAATAVREALQGIAGCHAELAEELLVARPELLLFDAQQQVLPKLQLIAAAAAAFPEDDASDLLVRYHRSTAELLAEAAAWPCALRLSNDRFRAALGLLLQLVAAARAAPGPATGTAGGPSAPTPGAAHEEPAGGPGQVSDASSAARSARAVLLEASSRHIGELLCAGTARVTAAADALQAYLGWPPQLAARVLLGCPTAPAAHALLGEGLATELAARCGPELLALATRAVHPAGSSAAGNECVGSASPFGPASLPHSSPARIAQVAAWLGHLGFDRPATALLTAAAQQDWAAADLPNLQASAKQWAEEARLPPGAAAAALWLAGVPPDSALAEHLALQAAKGASQEELGKMALGAVCAALHPGGGGGGDAGGP
ncbi:hypothetical protein ABPG75_002931 [Micractinium tetrahymenae]